MTRAEALGLRHRFSLSRTKFFSGKTDVALADAALRANVSSWPYPEVRVEAKGVRLLGLSGKHLLGLRITGFDVVDGARSRHRGAIE